MASSTMTASTGVEVAGRLGALADPVRLAIIGVLTDGAHCVCDLQARVPIATNLLSYHLRVLRQARLVTATRRGRWVDYQLNATAFSDLWAAAAAAGVPLPGTTTSEPQHPAPPRTATEVET
jgi:ArsR family transcriptional regulator